MDSFLLAFLLGLFLAVAVYAFVVLDFRVPQRPVEIQNHLDWWGPDAPVPYPVFITLEPVEADIDE